VCQRIEDAQVHHPFARAELVHGLRVACLQHFTAAAETYDALAADQPRHATGQAILAASLYPSIVSRTAAMASPHWAQIAHSHRPDQFLDRISVEVTEGWQPHGAFDPLRH
jgi:hypothetical protein